MDNIDPMGLVGKAAGREMGLPDGNWKYLYSENWYEPDAALAVLNALPLAFNLLDAGVGTAKAAIDDVMGPGSGDAAEAFLVANPAALAKVPQVLEQVGGAAAELGGVALNRAGRSVSAAVEWWHARRPLGSPAGSVQIAPSARLPGRAMGAADHVRTRLPELQGSFAEAFDGSPRTRTFRAGERVYRTPNRKGEGLEPVDAPGAWYGTRRTTTRAGTESQYNVRKHANPREELRVYEFTEDTTVYYGRVAGGKGYQVLLPRDVDPGTVLRFLEKAPLK